MSADAVDASRAPAFYVEMSKEDKIKEDRDQKAFAKARLAHHPPEWALRPARLTLRA